MMRRIFRAWASRSRRPTLGAAVVAMAMVWAPNARATADYLEILKTEYGYQGLCVVCHKDNLGGKGTITTDFGKALMDLGLVVGYQPNRMREVMQSDRIQTGDTDGDGISDLDELAEAGDPNDPGIGLGGYAYTPVEYGCSIVSAVGRSTPDRGGDPLAFMLSSLVAISLLLDRRRRLRRA